MIEERSSELHQAQQHIEEDEDEGMNGSVLGKVGAKVQVLLYMSLSSNLVWFRVRLDPV